MELKGFIKNFSAQFDETDEDVFVAETKFRELDEWSSLTGLLIISMIDEEYGLQINAEILRSCSTVGELYDRVSSMLK
jgi:acyl carrier protein